MAPYLQRHDHRLRSPSIERHTITLTKVSCAAAAAGAGSGSSNGSIRGRQARHPSRKFLRQGAAESPSRHEWQAIDRSKATNARGNYTSNPAHSDRRVGEHLPSLDAFDDRIACLAKGGYLIHWRCGTVHWRHLSRARVAPRQPEAASSGRRLQPGRARRPAAPRRPPRPPDHVPMFRFA